MTKKALPHGFHHTVIERKILIKTNGQLLIDALVEATQLSKQILKSALDKGCGMVRSSEAIVEGDSLDKILGKGQIVVTLYNEQTDHSFQSLVSKNSKGLIATFEDYFSQSEQLDSKLWVSSTHNKLTIPSP